MKSSLILLFALLALGSGSCTSAPQAIKTQSVKNWPELKYGMFIHYGMATFTGRASENDPKNAAEPSSLYAPTQLDVDQWMRVAKDAGMKYAVLTAKHSSGHCLWDSKVQFRGKEFDYDVATSGDKTDVVADFVKACAKHDILPGLYWCLEDHHNKAKPTKEQRMPPLPEEFFQFAQDQLTELIKNYPEVAYYWLDIPPAATGTQRQALFDLIKSRRPGAIVLLNGHGKNIADCISRGGWPTDILNSERHPIKPGQFAPEQTWEGKTYSFGYEHCDTLAQHWFWNSSDKPRPTPQLLELYQQVRAAGGNLLLDVAPDTSGQIPEINIKALQELKQAIDKTEKPAP